MVDNVEIWYGVVDKKNHLKAVRETHFEAKIQRDHNAGLAKSLSIVEVEVKVVRKVED